MYKYCRASLVYIAFVVLRQLYIVWVIDSSWSISDAYPEYTPPKCAGDTLQLTSSYLGNVHVTTYMMYMQLYIYTN